MYSCRNRSINNSEPFWTQGSKVASNHDAATPMLPGCNEVLIVECNVGIIKLFI